MIMLQLVISLLLSVEKVKAGFTVPLGTYLPLAESVAYNKIQLAVRSGTNTFVAYPSATLGSKLAALSGTCPNYAYTWARDQALVFSVVMDKYESIPTNTPERQKYEQMLKDYATFSDTIYVKNANPLWYSSGGRPWSLAEAKHEMDGSMFLGGWCSPQNDGPALRAVVLMRFATKYQSNYPADTTYVSQNLYTTSLAIGVKNPIKRDLEFLATNWDNDNCEPWEEVSGKHFYNRLMARRAMKNGAAFTTTLDPTASALYLSKVGAIETAISTHWDGATAQIKPTNNVNRYDDIQTTLALLHSRSEEDMYYHPSGDYGLADAYYTINSQDDIFNINAMNFNGQPQLGPALGRYSGDVYNGGCSYANNVCPAPCGGQPWFLSVNGMAELMYKAANKFITDGSVTVNSYNKDLFTYFGGGQEIVNQALPKTYASNTLGFSHIITSLLHGADSFMKRTEYHTDANYKLDEQFNADTGAMMSAGDLVWSYASLITANAARNISAPETKIPSFTSLAGAGKVQVELIMQGIPQNSAEVWVTGNTASLGNNVVCSGVKAYWRRNVKGVAEWSVYVTVPQSTSVTYKVAISSAGCTNTNLQTNTGTTFVTTTTNPLNAVYSYPTGFTTGSTLTTFRLNGGVSTITGEEIYFVGNIPLLGSWNTCNAVQATWLNQHTGQGSTYGDWSAVVSGIPPNTAVQWKFIKAGANPCTVIQWQSGSNEVFTAGTTSTTQVVTHI